MKNQVLIKL